MATPESSTINGQSRPFSHLTNVEGTPMIADHLATLGLNFDSTVENVHGVAISMRLRDVNKGTTRFERESLSWALQQTGDCLAPDEFEDFFTRGTDFDKIAKKRS
jgi:hypothetical protein